MWRRVMGRLTGRTRDEEIEREIQDDLELEAEEWRQAGASVEDARAAARRALGSPLRVTEDIRAVSAWQTLDRLTQDLRYAVRTFARNPGFASVTLFILALGIGANTAIFSIVNAVLLRPLPFHEPDRLMMVDERLLPRFAHFEATAGDFMAWREQARAFSALSAFNDKTFNMAGRDRPEQVAGARISANLPSLLGVEPFLGRGFRPEEDVDGSNRVVLLGHGLWRRAFGADSRVIGSAIGLNGLSFTIVGVMPPGFRFPDQTELWMPMGFTAEELESRGHWVWAVGRLKPGVTREQAQQELELIMSRRPTPWRANVFPLMDQYVGDVRLALIVLLGASSLVLLIACVNVANLLLARSSVRQREIALRASLGASRGRIVQQLVTETVLLSTVGGALGLGLAYVLVNAVQKMPLAAIPRLDETAVDARVLLFTLVLSGVTGILFGLAPALRLSRTSLQNALKTGGRTAGPGGRARMRDALVVGELGLALVLLAGAGLLLKSFWRLLEMRPGFNAEHVLTARTALPELDYREAHQQAQFVARLLERLQNRPDVRAAAVSHGLPFASVSDSGVRFDRPDNHPLVGVAANDYRVTPHYFQAMGITLVKGRLFTDGDIAGSPPVVLINETMARRFFPNEDPIGKRLSVAAPFYWREIVGVVRDVKQEGPRAPIAPQVYQPYFQSPSGAFNIVVRGVGDEAALAEAMRQEVLAIDRYQPLSDVRTMQEIVSRSFIRDRFAALLIGLFAMLALVLAAVGIYGVIAYSVTQRTGEIGLRMALGAERGGILRLVLGHSMRLVLLGLGIGLAAAIAVTRVLSALLYEVQPRDPVTLVAVSVLLVAVALLAAFVPAHRASRVDPIVALRAE